MFESRKFVLTLIAVGAVLVVAVISGLLGKYLGIDISAVAKWAMVVIAGSIGLGQATIAYEDVGKSKAQAGQKAE
ncbi:MAG TPA: hypothetical protein VM487_10675 [Phycisphaerae bacterium]|nr:hypothetical protein [Phycisphaerae bacterium]HUX15148.1 hypothetical protein [Phycisphaerae bacterium]